MKILFLGRHHGYFRSYESVLRGLASRGHVLHLAVERDEHQGGLTLVESLAADYPAITFGSAPVRADDEWSWVAGRLRLGLDYLRYQHPVFDDAHKLRERSRERTPGAFVTLGGVVRALGTWSRTVASGVLRRLERAIPEDPRIRRYIEDVRPDLLLITPLIDLGSSQIDYLRAARAMRIPTALAVWSWDHLSSKALIRESPDRIFVWNETQKAEAVSLHGIDPARIVVTGAQSFDHWFDRQPSRDRAAFCREVGLDPSKPLVLYVCSALFAGSPPERELVETWIRALRSSSDPVLRDAAVLVRPHPSRAREWDGADLRSLGAAVWGGNPVDAQARADYFDSLFHSRAVVGLNTSAFIEAGIVGRPVHAILVPEFAANQTGTVHFRYLTEVAGGLVIVGRGMDEHLRQLAVSVTRETPGAPAFVRAFVRPRGLDQPATPCFVDEVEALAGLTPAPDEAPSGAVSRWVVRQLARTRTSRRLERWTLSTRELESVQHTRDEQQRKAFKRAEARAAADPARLETLRARADAFERDRTERFARQQPK